jgi:hypothetical protein
MVLVIRVRIMIHPRGIVLVTIVLVATMVWVTLLDAS